MGSIPTYSRHSRRHGQAAPPAIFLKKGGDGMDEVVVDIDMRELESFYHVVKEGSFSRAAQVLYLTQPTVSAHVASLARKLRVQLLVRTTKEVFLTDAGKLLFRYAEQILNLREEAVRAVESFAKEMRGTIRVAASSIPGQYYLPKLIQGFRCLYPEVNFSLETLDSGEVVERVTARKVDLGFTGTMIASGKCTYEVFAEDRLVVITPNTPKYRTYLSTGFPIRQLTRENFIRREAGSGTRIETENFLREMGVDVDKITTAVEVRSTESIKQMVSEGLGISMISQSASRDYCQFQKILAFNFDNVSLRRKLYLVHHKNSILSPIAQAFYDYAIKFGSGKGGAAGLREPLPSYSNKK